MNQNIDDILQGIETALRSIIENVGPGDDIDAWTMPSNGEPFAKIASFAAILTCILA